MAGTVKIVTRKEIHVRKFKGHVTIGLVGCKREFEFEMEDDASDDDLEEAAREEMYNIVNYWYEEVA
jgi:hypothetical protein